mgnify:CR=1 FL=1
MLRDDAIRLIRCRYGAVFGATPLVDYPQLLVADRAHGAAAACGYRRASSEPLFLETYLDQPIEALAAAALGRHIARTDVIEIGNLASHNASAMVALWAQAANDLAADAEVAVAVLTAPLRRMFGRLGLQLIDIAPADPARLGADAERWGSYYAQDPRICVGLIAEGQEKLSRFTRRAAMQRAKAHCA